MLLEPMSYTPGTDMEAGLNAQRTTGTVLCLRLTTLLRLERASLKQIVLDLAVYHLRTPNRGWVADITYLWTLEVSSYLAVILDWFSPTWLAER
jgi:hypothetical protein